MKSQEKDQLEDAKDRQRVAFQLRGSVSSIRLEVEDAVVRSRTY